MSARIFKADAVALLQSLEPSSVDAILSDPPYCSGGFNEAGKRSGSVGRDGGRDYDIALDRLGTSGYTELLRRVSVEAFRVLKPGSWLFLFADWRMVSVVQPAVESAGPQFRSLICWAKNTPGMGLGFRSQHEMILAFSIGKPRVHSRSFGNVIQCKRSKNEHHPTEKPLGVLSPLLEVATAAGDLVVDPFMGSGSTGVAALMMGRRFIGCELDQGHIDTAFGRLSNCGASVECNQATIKPQPSLFGVV